MLNNTINHNQLQEWTSIVTEQLPLLTKPQATVLALLSFGMVLVKSCALTSVGLTLAVLLGVKENTIRQRLREWCYNQKDKKGLKRSQLHVESCFPFLLRWIISWWNGNQLALAVDATTLKDVFTVLAVSVVYRGCAIPVAWTILEGNQKRAWTEEWLRMLAGLKPGIPEDMTVMVMTDRGLYSPRLFRAICGKGWHPFMRVNARGYFYAEGTGYFRPLPSFAPKPGTYYKGRGIAFKKNKVKCTLLACWEEGMKEQWFILTDLPPEASEACWYGMRAWIEQGFRMTKRGGWQWHRSRMKEPDRASRVWLAISVTTIWLLSAGGEADQSIPESTFLEVTADLMEMKQQRKTTRLRFVRRIHRISVFRRGWIAIFVSLIHHQSLPLSRFIPEPWTRISNRYLNIGKQKAMKC